MIISIKMQKKATKKFADKFFYFSSPLFYFNFFLFFISISFCFILDFYFSYLFIYSFTGIAFFYRRLWIILWWWKYMHAWHTHIYYIIGRENVLEKKRESRKKILCASRKKILENFPRWFGVTVHCIRIRPVLKDYI